MEIFKPVLGYEGLYQASNFGRVKSIARTDQAGKSRKEKLLKKFLNEDGYERVCFFLDGKATHPFVHRVIFEAFFGRIPEGMEINHKNGIKIDNIPSNLEAITHAENMLHSKEVLKSDFVSFGNGRMTAEQVREIRKSLSSGFTHKRISEKFGFSETSIWNIAHRKTWRHID